MNRNRIDTANSYATQQVIAKNHYTHTRIRELIRDGFLAGMKTVETSPEYMPDIQRLLAENRLLSQQVDQLSRKLQEARGV